MITRHLLTALRQLQRNKGRSVLTMLGIIIGIGSVIFIMTAGEIAKNFLLGQITQFGTNVVEVAVQGAFGPFGEHQDIFLSDEDVTTLRAHRLLPEVEAISAGFTTLQTMEVDGEQQLISLFGDYPDFAVVNNIHLLHGRFFRESDVHSRRRVMVIGEQLATQIASSGEEAIGKRIKIRGTFFHVIGVIEELPFQAMGFAPDVGYAPISTVKELYAEGDEKKKITYLLIAFRRGTDVGSFMDRIDVVLRKQHNIPESEESPFAIVSREQFLTIFNNVLLAIQFFISSVAAISLLVGGIGIMNIMLVTVKERTKEIGLRKAVGAKNSAIRTQFLIEAIVLTTVGGIIGILLGLGFSAAGVAIVHVVQPEWDIAFVFLPSSIVIACAVAMSVGLIFGFYPAWKASTLHPIDALRYE